MYTRLTGWALPVVPRRCTRLASKALPGAVTTIFPSIPAVLWPAFCSVTRRTLTSALARDRSISFCKLRTFLRSPACDAVKMRWRRRRTSSSTWGQSIDPQSRSSPSGPFTTAVTPPWRPTYPSVPGPRSPYPHRLTRPASAPFRVRAPARIRPVMREDRRKAGHRSPVSCCLSATGIRFPGRPTPLEDWATLASGLPATSPCPDPNRVPTFHSARNDRGGCLLYPEGGGALPADKKSPAGACRFTAASPYAPPYIHRARLTITRHQRRFTRFTRPVCPLPVTPRWNRGPSAFPRASHPAVTSSARRGWGQAIEHWPGATYPVYRPASVLRAHSLRATSCRSFFLVSTLRIGKLAALKIARCTAM